MRSPYFALITLAHAASVTIPHTSVAEPAPEPLLIAHWSFDEGKGLETADVSGNGNHATIAKSSVGTKWVEGRTGNALAFSGNQETRGENGCVAVKGMGKHDFGKGLTVEAWIKPSKAMRREGTYEIVTNTVSDRGTGFRFRASWDALQLVSGEGGEGETWGAGSNASKTRLAKEVWHHVAGTYDGSVFRVYLDGEEVGASEPDLKLTRGRGVVSIGAYRDGYAYGFEGVIDDVRIYDGALSPLQVLRRAKLGN